MGAPIIEISGLCFSYDGTEVLHDVSLTIFERDFVAVIGPNGGGKTTLLKLILGLLKPSRGTIKLRGRSLGSGTAIGYVPQQIDHTLNFPATALDIVLMGMHTPRRRLFFRHSSNDRHKALEALEQMGISGLAETKITDLSGGQRQRILIARALVSKPDLLVLDEPTASIDAKGQAEFYSLLSTLNRNLTIFMASHDLLTISSYAKSIACVNRRLHYHRTFEDSGELLNAFYSCSVDEACPVEAVSRKIARLQNNTGGSDD